MQDGEIQVDEPDRVWVYWSIYNNDTSIYLAQIRYMLFGNWFLDDRSNNRPEFVQFKFKINQNIATTEGIYQYRSNWVLLMSWSYKLIGLILSWLLL